MHKVFELKTQGGAEDISTDQKKISLYMNNKIEEIKLIINNLYNILFLSSLKLLKKSENTYQP